MTIFSFIYHIEGDDFQLKLIKAINQSSARRIFDNFIGNNDVYIDEIREINPPAPAENVVIVVAHADTYEPQSVVIIDANRLSRSEHENFAINEIREDIGDGDIEVYIDAFARLNDATLLQKSEPKKAVKNTKRDAPITKEAEFILNEIKRNGRKRSTIEAALAKYRGFRSIQCANNANSKVERPIMIALTQEGERVDEWETTSTNLNYEAMLQHARSTGCMDPNFDLEFIAYAISGTPDQVIMSGRITQP